MKKWFKKISIALGRKKNTSDQKIEKKIKSFDPTISNTAETAKTKAAPPEKIEIKPIIAKEAPPKKIEIKPTITKEAPPEKIEIKPTIAKEAPPEKTKTETEHENIKKSWFNKLGVNFKKTSSSIKEAIFSKRLDENFIANIEDAFLLSDLGVSYTNLLIDELKKKKFDDKNIKNQISNFLLSQFSEINHDLDLKSEKKIKSVIIFRSKRVR
ncbi:MAG: hypothetical protein CMP40_01960 [Rickettsiales bacterium]|nr:hypothetical protein [Rickettsiales bacterium]